MMWKRAHLDEFLERTLRAQLIASFQRGETGRTSAWRGCKLTWALEQGLLRSPIPDLLLLSAGDTVFLWELGIRADNELAWIIKDFRYEQRKGA